MDLAVNYMTTELLGAEHIRLLRTAIALVEVVPVENPNGELVRCHELSRAVAEVLGLTDKVRDGRYCRTIEHSWITLRDDEPDTLILDVYRPGCVPIVQLVNVPRWPSINRGYIVDPEYIPAIREEDVEWLVALMRNVYSA